MIGALPCSPLDGYFSAEEPGLLDFKTNTGSFACFDSIVSLKKSE